MRKRAQSRIEAVAVRAEQLEVARIGEFVGQSLSVTADTYTRVLADETELDYARLLWI